jgi:hypothetical protein
LFKVNAQNRGGDTPLHRAAFMGHQEITQILLSANSNINLVNSDGQTALHRAFNNKKIDVSNIVGGSLFGKAYLLIFCLQIVNLLLRNNADPALQDNKQQTYDQL